jgi:acyl-CoA dehydrogenase
MDFELPEELKLVKQTLRRYVDTQLIPIERETCDTSGTEIKPEYKKRFEKDAKDLGLWLMDIPAEFGGQGMGVLATCVVVEELARTIALPARGSHFMGPSIRAILYDLSDEMKEKYLYPVIRGEKRACFGQTEPDAGSDPGSMRTTAVRDGDHYVINGTKRFITGAGKADFIQLMAATDRSKGSHGGISCFIVDMNTPGVKLAAQYETMMGDKPWEIVFDNVRVPASQMVGKEGQGFRLGQGWIGAGRLRHGARALGVAERCLEMMTAYSKIRVTFGKPLSERQSAQFTIADSYMEIHAGRLMLYHAAAKADAGEDFRNEAYICKYYCDEMAFRVADRCMQMHGGIGLTTDLPIERMWRSQRSFRITEGPSEVMKMVVARHVMNTYK